MIQTASRIINDLRISQLLFHFKESLMKTTARFILVAVVIAMMSAAFRPTQAAAGVPAAVKMPEKIAGGRPVTFTITNMPPESDTVKRKEWDDRIARFQKLYPNVTVKGLEYTYAVDTFAALVAGKQVPTMFQVYLTDPRKY